MSEWDGILLEEWVEKMLRDGYTEIVVMLMNVLPEEKKIKYREVYERVMIEKKNIRTQNVFEEK